MNNWYSPLRDLVSMGSTAKRPGSLAGLAQARREHMGQFFTPDALAKYMWQIVSPAMERYAGKKHNGKVSILDNSVGSGRLLQYASPDLHVLGGADIDQAAVHALSLAAQEAGFEYEFLTEGMENIRVQGYSVALINPPFSVNLQSPNLLPYECTSWGKFGINTSAASHGYALVQALEAADIVAAILPSAFAQAVVDAGQYGDRLRAHLKMPRAAFREEGTEVDVDLLVFNSGNAKGKFEQFIVQSLDDVPDLGLEIASSSRPRLTSVEIEQDEPAITMPVTGNKTVRVSHDGRRVKLHFQCGFTQARVMNAIMVAKLRPMDGHRHPRGLRYIGEGVLDLEVHLVQNDPVFSFETFIAKIANADAVPQVDAGLIQHIRRKAKQTVRQSMPLKHMVQIPVGASDADKLTGKARKTHVADPKVWGSPVIQAGHEIHFAKAVGGYAYLVNGKKFLVALDEIHQRFETAGVKSPGWVVAHAGLLPAYPQQHKMWEARAKALGIHHWLSFHFQFQDVCELLMKPEGAIVAWEMGLGKARLAAALCLLSGCKHNLMVVEAYALPETRDELDGLPIPKSDWQVIDSPEKLLNLRKINLISLSRLRMSIEMSRPAITDPTKLRRRLGAGMTYAKKLRRRIGTMVVDEGHFMANRDSAQSRACYAVSAKKRYITSGTPLANMPRDILALLTFTAGDGTASQAYGTYKPYLEPNHVTTMQHAVRGVEKFMGDFVTLEWVTNEFAESLRHGAKREIPKIGNLSKYRDMLAPHVLRRLDCEPEVTPYVQIPKPTETVIQVDWDEGHLAHYLHVAEDFVSWYGKVQVSGKRLSSLVAILAKIGAVEMASNFPQRPGLMGSYQPLTSKQRAAIDWLSKRTQEGHKSIMFAKNPGVLEIIKLELDKLGIESVVFHGGIPVEKRCAELNSRFRYGPAPVLLATLGVTQSSLNIWQADRVLLYGRDWAYKTEAQAIRRVCRPQQTRDIEVAYLQLKGSVDQYQQQMVENKRDCAMAGLDWATPELDDVEFLHLDTVLGRFVSDVAKLRGILPHQLRSSLVTEAEQLELL